MTKQLLASQKILAGLRSLPSYADIEQKQALGLLKIIETGNGLSFYNSIGKESPHFRHTTKGIPIRTETKDRRVSFFLHFGRAHMSARCPLVSAAKKCHSGRSPCPRFCMSASITGCRVVGYKNHQIPKNLACPRKSTCPPDVRGVNHVRVFFCNIWLESSNNLTSCPICSLDNMWLVPQQSNRTYICTQSSCSIRQILSSENPIWNSCWRLVLP